MGYSSLAFLALRDPIDTTPIYLEKGPEYVCTFEGNAEVRVSKVK